MVNAILIFCFSAISLAACYEFPPDFIFGAATASYQIEGGWNASGKGENIWDRLTHAHPERIKDRSSGDIACDSYNKWEEDIQLCKYLGLDFYRFSLSWSRILPTGMSNEVNPDGIRYYNNLINGLLENGIEPFVTIYHWDLPQPLQDIGGWPNPLLAEYFVDYADVVFKNFGDRVKKWITFNEPLQVCDPGYGDNLAAPGMNSSGIGDYLCSKTLLIAHAKTYRMYYEKYASKQKGIVGITCNVDWAEPASPSQEDIDAADRKMEIELGRFVNPIFSEKGNFPEVMLQRVAEISKRDGYSRSRLIGFTPEESELLKGSADFFGLNYYTAWMVEHEELPPESPTSYAKDMGVKSYKHPSWEPTDVPWLTSNAFGFRKTMKWIKERYNNPLIYITENGMGDVGQLQDDKRIDYYTTHLQALLEAIYEDDCNVKGYTAWSLLDNMEWLSGYTLKFGLIHVDFEDPQRTRTTKTSAEFYKKIIANRKLPN